jgi:hypothetical protein
MCCCAALHRLNLENLQHVAPPDDLWAQVAATAQLQPQQAEHILRAYLTYDQQQAQLLQQQRVIMGRLQSTSGMQVPAPFDAAAATAAAAGQSARQPAGQSAGTSAGRSMLTAQQLQALTDMCRNRASGDGSGTGSSSLLGGPAGMLSLECAEKAEELLQDLQRISRMLKQHARLLSTMVRASWQWPYPPW